MYKVIIMAILGRLRFLKLLIGSLIVLSFAYSLVCFYNEISTSQLSQPSEQKKSAHVNLPSVQDLGQLEWFGVSKGTQNIQSSAAVAADSQLILKGVSKSEHSRLVGAFIAIKGQPENYYRINQELPNGLGNLSAVFKDYVEIRSNQGVSILRFNKE